MIEQNPRGPLHPAIETDTVVHLHQDGGGKLWVIPEGTGKAVEVYGDPPVGTFYRIASTYWIEWHDMTREEARAARMYPIPRSLIEDPEARRLATFRRVDGVEGVEYHVDPWTLPAHVRRYLGVMEGDATLHSHGPGGAT